MFSDGQDNVSALVSSDVRRTPLELPEEQKLIAFRRRERIYQVEIVPIHQKRNDEGENQ